MSLNEELKIAPANELRHVRSLTKGTLAQTEIDEYEEITPESKAIARYTVTEQTNPARPQYDTFHPKAERCLIDRETRRRAARETRTQRVQH